MSTCKPFTKACEYFASIYMHCTRGGVADWFSVGDCSAVCQQYAMNNNYRARTDYDTIMQPVCDFIIYLQHFLQYS